jgi:cobalt-zinc-cadmium efflux system membrane fusion protein
MNKFALILTAALVAPLFTGCKESKPSLPAKADTYVPPSQPNAILVNQLTRNNLGISFVEAEKRPVRRTFRLPGQFELRPDAFREYTATFPGHIQLMVTQYQNVKAGDVLFKLNSPDWRRFQHELGEALNTIRVTEGKIEVAEKNLLEVENQVTTLQARIDRLAAANVKKAELDTERTNLQSRLAVLKAEKNLTVKEFEAASEHYRIMIHTASELSGFNEDQLLKPVDLEGQKVPFWRTIDRLVYTAKRDGLVSQVNATEGGWAEVGNPIIQTVEPQAIRFRAEALQGDLLNFRTGQSARIVATQGAGKDMNAAMTGKIQVGFEGNAAQRTFPIFVTPEKLLPWANAGVAAFVEVFVEGNEKPTLAIPRQCIVRDGLEDVFFRRNPKNSDEVLRIVADKGTDDGRWVEIKSGLRKGDEIVLHGAYELKLASAGGVNGGKEEPKGHFHADGTYHEGEH